MKMNILQYIDFLMDEYGMSEEDAYREADAAIVCGEFNREE